MDNKTILKNKGLVISIAKRYQGKGLDFDDLVQEGYIGLIKAEKGYKPDKGTKFSTYATYWIKQSIIRAIENTGSLVRVPSHANDLNTPKHVILDREVKGATSTVNYQHLLGKVRDILTDDTDYCMFIEYHIFDKSFRDIAKDQGCSHENVRTRLSKLSSTIRKRLTK